MRLNYKMLLTNGDYVLRHHFSADEFGILETSITMFLVYILFILLGFVYSKILYTQSFLHVTYKLFFSTVIIEWVSFLMYMAEYGQFSVSGKHTPGMITSGNNCLILITVLLKLINFENSLKKKRKFLMPLLR